MRRTPRRARAAALIAAAAALPLAVAPARAAAGDVHTLAGSGATTQAFPYGNDGGFAGDGGPATSARLNTPADVAVDGAGNIYVADQRNKRIRKVATNGVISTFATLETYPGSVVVKPDASRVWATTAAVPQRRGTALVEFDGLGQVLSTRALDVQGIALSPGGLLHFTSPGDGTVRRIGSDGTIAIVAGGGTQGTCANPAEGVAAIAAVLCAPSDLAWTSQGHLHISDSGSNRVRKVDASGLVRTVAGGGSTRPVEGRFDGVPALDAWFTGPRDIGFDPRDNLYVGGVTEFNGFLRIDAISGVVRRVAGNGCGSLAQDECVMRDDVRATETSLFAAGFSVRAQGTIVVADWGNSRVRWIEAFPFATPAPAALDFGVVDVGRAVSLNVTVRNSGMAALHVTGASFDGVSPGDYSLSVHDCANVAPGGLCSMTIRFSPAAGGARTATMRIHSDAIRPDAATVAVAGVGRVFPGIRFAPSGVVFGNVPLGQASAPVNVVGTSSGTAPVTLGAAVRAGAQAADFALLTDDCSNRTLDPGQTCTLSVRFTPSAEGLRTATVEYPTDTGGGRAVITLDGSAGPLIDVNPLTVFFGPTSPGSVQGPRALEVRNAGSGVLTVGAASISGAHRDDFRIASDGCAGAALGAGQACSVGVEFRPVAIGARTAVVMIPSNAPGGPVAIALEGPAVDVRAPVSRIDTGDGAIVGPVIGSLSGSVTDDHSGVASLTIHMTPVAGAPYAVQAGLRCNAARTSCTWTATPLIPGIYTATARAVDEAGNAEANGPSMTVIVI